MTRRRRLLGAVTTAAVLLLAEATAGSTPLEARGPRFTSGSSGVGDSYFPYSGNGGYDVLHYDLQVTYTPPAPAPAPVTGHLSGVATITLRATQDLDRLNLDLRGMDVTSLTIDGKSAEGIAPPPEGAVVEGRAYWQTQDDAARVWELTVQPRPKPMQGTVVELVVTYEGTTIRPRDIEGALYGWVTTRDGAMVVSEPEGSMTWYPVNDHPTDKATYSFAITVPEGKVAVANGLPAQDPVTNDGWTTWYWDAPDQQASYLTTASVGDFEQRATGYSASGVPILDFVDSKLSTGQRATTDATLALQPQMIDLFEGMYGPYPFNSYGSIVDNDTVGYALETQTRPVYSGSASQNTAAHELAHQWFGNSVSPQRWQDIWLNEGWATYASWQWREHIGQTTTQALFDNEMARSATSSFWQLSVADPGPLGLFATPIYNRGAATLHALRVKVGDPAFFAAAQLWLERYADGTGTTELFQAVYEEVSGLDLTTFFDVWVRQPVKPTEW